MVRTVSDPVAASRLLVDHALSRFSTDNLSCMIVRFDREALLQSRNQASLGVESSSADKGSKAVASEVDKIVKETRQKIADGSTPAVGVSASNGGRGHDAVATVEEKEKEKGGFKPTTLGGAGSEEKAGAERSELKTAETTAEGLKPGAALRGEEKDSKANTAT